MERELQKPSELEYAQLAAETLAVFGIDDPYGWWGHPAKLGRSVLLQILVGGSLTSLASTRLRALKEANPAYMASPMALALVRLAALDLIHLKLTLEPPA